jgi:hypothetical protein
MRRLPILALLAALGCTHNVTTAPDNFQVEGRVALASLVALSDEHLSQVADHFQVLANSDDGKSADWARISSKLAAVQQINVPGLYWFATSDGSYWSVAQGRATGNLSDRAYWPRLMAGHVVLGDLVASKATGKSTAIVAVPIHNATGAVVGVVGSSIYLDSLSLLIKREIDLQPGLLFFSVDATPIGALQDDPDQIFLDPYNIGEPDLARAIREMLSRDEGVVNYQFRGKGRTVLYRKSNTSGWWYAFGRAWD